MDDNTARCIDLLDGIEKVVTRFHPEDDAPTDTLAAFVRAFEELRTEGRDSIRELVTETAAKKLLGLSSFASARAIDTEQPQWLRVAVLAHVVEDFRIDYRENYMHLFLVAHAAWRIDADLPAIVRALLPLATARAARWLRGFTSNAVGEASLRSLGLVEERHEGRTRFTAVQ